MRNLLIVGAGKNGHFIKETAATMQVFDKIDFVGDLPDDIHINLFYNYRSLLREYTYAFSAYSSAVQRLEWIGKLKEQGFKIPVLKHSTAFIDPSATISEGTIIGAMAVIYSNVQIEKGCIISLGTNIEHDAIIRAGSFLDIGARIKSYQVYQPINVNEFSGVFDRELSFFFR